MQKLVSVVIPTYNMENYLDRCMKTFLNQTSKDFEIILVDDGSTDRSPEMCDAYSEKYPEFISCIHIENNGLSQARNAGIREADGQYIVFPDPDDWVEEDYIESLVEAQNKSGADLVCLGHYVDFSDKTVSANEGFKSVEMDADEAKKHLIIEPALNGFAWNKLYHMDIIKEHSLEFLDDTGTKEDLDFVYRYLKYCSKVFFNPEKRIYHYFQREGAATWGSFSLKKAAGIHAYEKMLEDCPEGMESSIKASICSSAMNLLIMYYTDKSDDKEILKYLKLCFKDNKDVYLKSNTSMGRKLQAIICSISPKLLAKIKGL